MMDSRFDTLSVPRLVLSGAAGRGTDAPKKLAATPIVNASKHPLRVIVQNVSFAAEMYLAYDAATLQDNEPGSGTFLLQAGNSVTIMLAPSQRLYAISLSDGCLVSVAISEALPIDTKG